MEGSSLFSKEEELIMSQPVARGSEPSDEILAHGQRRKEKKMPQAILDSSSGGTVCDDETILRELVS